MSFHPHDDARENIRWMSNYDPAQRLTQQLKASLAQLKANAAKVDATTRRDFYAEAHAIAEGRTLLLPQREHLAALIARLPEVR